MNIKLRKKTKKPYWNRYIQVDEKFSFRKKYGHVRQGRDIKILQPKKTKKLIGVRAKLS